MEIEMNSVEITEKKAAGWVLAQEHNLLGKLV